MRLNNVVKEYMGGKRGPKLLMWGNLENGEIFWKNIQILLVKMEWCGNSEPTFLHVTNQLEQNNREEFSSTLSSPCPFRQGICSLANRYLHQAGLFIHITYLDSGLPELATAGRDSHTNTTNVSTSHLRVISPVLNQSSFSLTVFAWWSQYLHGEDVWSIDKSESDILT